MKSGLAVKSAVKAGGIGLNHNRRASRSSPPSRPVARPQPQPLGPEGQVRRQGRVAGFNHNRSGLKVKSAVKAGLAGMNHNRAQIG